MSSVHYLSPGPSRLPEAVRGQIHDELLDTFGFGVSVMEISHRSPAYSELSDETLELTTRVLGVPDTHALLLTPFGAQQHFTLLIHHLSRKGDTISYVESGVWSQLAVKDARNSGRVLDMVYSGVPNFESLGEVEKYKPASGSRFFHLTVNNTVYGTEYPDIPEHFEPPLVLDMTSSLFARTDIPWPKVGLIYASAQKNFGIAGVSIVIVRKDLLEASESLIAESHFGDALNYKRIYERKSALNTPPVMPIYVANRMIRWMEKEGGVPEMEKRSLEKARLMYAQVDGEFYRGIAVPHQRSRHNISFRLPDEELTNVFIEEAAAEQILEIKGYRGVGGIRASFYNGVDVHSAQVLSEFMAEFRRTRG